MVLDRCGKDLHQLCSELQDPEEQRRCWQVYRFYESRRAAAQAGCVRELSAGGRPGATCEALDELERMVLELMSAGHTEDVYAILKVQEELSRTGAGPAAAAAAARVPTAEEARHEDRIAHLRSRAGELFGLMDSNGDGAVDREEFIIGMNMLRDELGWDEAELGTVFGAIDCHGHVTAEQFADILVAEELRDPSADAEVLRHVGRHGRARGADSAPTWSY